MGEFSYIQTELACIHPFTLPVCDKDENQEIESIEPSLGEGNALSLTINKWKIFRKMKADLALQALYESV